MHKKQSKRQDFEGQKKGSSRYTVRNCVASHTGRGFAANETDQIISSYSPELQSYAEKFELQNIFRSIALNPRFNTKKEQKAIKGGHLPRISHCLRKPLGSSVALMKNPSSKAAHYSKLQTCGSAYGCPICATKITQQRASEINQACEVWKANDPNNTILMITYTIPHYQKQFFAHIRRNYAQTRREFKRQKPLNLQKLKMQADFPVSTVLPFIEYKQLKKMFNIEHEISAMDFTWSSMNSYHVHSHDLLFCSRHLTDEEIAFLQDQMIRSWIYNYAKRNPITEKTIQYMMQHAIKVQRSKNPADYIAKFGMEVFEKNRALFSGKWGSANELTQSHLKHGKSNHLTPWDLARIIYMSHGNKDVYKFFGRLLADFVQGMKGKHMIQWSKGSKQYFRIKAISDQEIASSTEKDSELLLFIDTADWYTIVANNMRSRLAIFAGSNDVDSIKKWIKNLYNPQKMQDLYPLLRSGSEQNSG